MVLGDLLKCRTEDLPEAEAIVLYATGEVDLSTAPILLNALQPIVQNHHHAIVDLSQVEYFDGSGFRVLETCHVMARDKGRQLVVVAPPPSRIRRLFGLLRLDRVILLVASIGEAAASIRAPGEAGPSVQEDPTRR